MAKSIIKHGVVIGTGAALNVELGWVPNSVELFNVTDNDIITQTFLDWILPFTSGGVVEIVAGMDIKGATSNATGRVKQVVASAATWSAGTAAGILVLDADYLVGTFGSENIYVTSDVVTGIDDATVTANVNHTIASGASTLAAATTTSAMSRYEGVVAANAKGFTIGSVISESGKVLRYRAFRDDA
jgi:hypothetical protein